MNEEIRGSADISRCHEEEGVLARTREGSIEAIKKYEARTTKGIQK